VLEGFVAERGGAPVGMALFQVVYSTFGGTAGLWLEDLIVLPAERGGGVGAALLARLARVATVRRWGFMAWNVLDWNRPAIRFYRALGAELKREWILTRLTGPPLARLAGISAAGRRAPARARSAGRARTPRS